MSSGRTGRHVVAFCAKQAEDGVAIFVAICSHLTELDLFNGQSWSNMWNLGIFAPISLRWHRICAGGSAAGNYLLVCRYGPLPLYVIYD